MEKKIQTATFAALIVVLALNAIVAVGNWYLYARMSKIETTLGLRAMPQSPRISSQEKQPKRQE